MSFPLTESLIEIKRIKVHVTGLVQGVGFRPHVYRLAQTLSLKGWVRNTGEGLEADVEGRDENLKSFIKSLSNEPPPNSVVSSIACVQMEPCGHETFDIQDSDQDTPKLSPVLPDLAVCSKCLSEVFDSGNRRYLYPFTNCTHCGPRYSITYSLPSDRLPLVATNGRPYFLKRM